MHIDISLLYVALVVTAIGTTLLTPLARYRSTWQRSPRHMKILLACTICFGGLSLLSILWSPNPIKGFVTAAHLCAILVVVVNMVVHFDILHRHRQRIVRTVGLSCTLAVAFGYWQILADTIGLPSTWSLLPEAYRSAVFGFARPTGLSWEPQFFGSLLLIPTLYLSYKILWQGINVSQIILLVMFATMLFLTLSRGAIYSFVVAIVLLIAYMIYQNRAALLSVFRAIALYSGVLIMAVVLSGAIISLSAQANTRDEISGRDALAKYVDQMSLGTITLPSKPSPTPAAPTTLVQTPHSPSPSDGYVSSSTDSRLSMSATALELWMSNPMTTLIGVGFGGYGTAAHARYPELVSHSIVNNYYLEVLVETGIIGLSLLITVLGGTLYWLLSRKQILLAIMLVAICIQMIFYSGNANTIHIWIVLGLALGVIANHKHIKTLKFGV